MLLTRVSIARIQMTRKIDHVPHHVTPRNKILKNLKFDQIFILKMHKNGHFSRFRRKTVIFDVRLFCIMQQFVGHLYLQKLLH